MGAVLLAVREMRRAKGSGKTTLLSIAGGLLSATRGRVVVGGKDVSDLDPRQLTKFRQSEVGFVFQAVNLVPFLTARENLTVVGELAGRPRKATASRASRLLDELRSPEIREPRQPVVPACANGWPSGGR